MIRYIIAVIGFLLVELKALDFLYHFQVKEYRTDRFLAMMRERGFSRIFFAIARLPAKTLRNFLSALAITFLTFLLTVTVYNHDFLLALMFALYWLMAFLISAFAVFLTWTPSALRKIVLTRAAAWKIRRLKVTVIGITGSFGKTTTKEYLAEILSQKFSTAKTQRNMNTDTGVSLSVLREVNPKTQYFIAEMGAYRPGEIRDICNIVRPRFAILTAIGNQHLHLFGSRERLIRAKKELLQSIPSDGKIYVNAGRSPVDVLRAGVDAPFVTYRSTEKSVDLNAYNLPPEIIRENLIPCILISRDLGLTEKEIRNGILSLKNRRHRLTPMAGKNGSVIIDNSYNTNREGFIYSIGVLKERRETEKILVTPGIIELGKEKQSTYGEILHVLENSGVTLFTTDADFGKSRKKNVRIFENENAMKKEITTKLNRNSVILVEGKMNRDFISFIKNQ